MLPRHTKAVAAATLATTFTQSLLLPPPPPAVALAAIEVAGEVLTTLPLSVKCFFLSLIVDEMHEKENEHCLLL